MEAVRSGATGVDEAVDALRGLPYEELAYATIDHHRALRCETPEVIFGAGKTPEQIVGIARSLAAAGAQVLATRVSDAAADELLRAFPAASHHPIARAVLVP